jgi:hypothetical protein
MTKLALKPVSKKVKNLKTKNDILAFKDCHVASANIILVEFHP